MLTDDEVMNLAYHFATLREWIDQFEPSRERSLAATKLDECEMWLDRCEPLVKVNEDQRNKVRRLDAATNVETRDG